MTLHAVLVLPALAWLLARPDLTERTRIKLVAAATISYVVVAAVVLAVTA